MALLNLRLVSLSLIVLIFWFPQSVFPQAPELAPPLSGHIPPWPATMLADAQINSVYFHDFDRGWAVGERGTIRTTENGGQTWTWQKSPVGCSLHSIFFINETTGWIVGGTIDPYTHQSAGILFTTTNGGRTWTQQATSLPNLTKVKFFNTKQGFVIGESSPYFPSSGLYLTNDGGKSWQPLSAPKAKEWVAADFSTLQNGAMGSPKGTVHALANGRQINAQTPERSPQKIVDIQLETDGNGWMLGEDCQLLFTTDHGQSWQTRQTTFPPLFQKNFRATTFFSQGNHLWIAGNPGSLILYSADYGLTWEPVSTDTTAPLTDLFFIDENRGWAVGNLGTILATRDGGKTWRVQEQGGQRLALLGLFCQTDQIPFELFVDASGNHGYRSYIEILSQNSHIDHTEKTGFQSSLAKRLAKGATYLGTAGGHLEIRPAPNTPSQNDAGSHLFDTLEEYLVLQIRKWKPSVLLTNKIDVNHPNSPETVFGKKVLAAAEKAANSSYYP
ncbi:MAG: YCF48-related protein, partial [Pirellulaceae bacterium]|nr:YCF48-related protein [Pirellulaceae bacterium]